MRAILTNKLNGESVEVHSTTEHPDSSYGQPVWVDDEGQAYCRAICPIHCTTFKSLRNERKGRSNQKESLLVVLREPRQPQRNGGSASLGVSKGVHIDA